MHVPCRRRSDQGGAQRARYAREGFCRKSRRIPLPRLPLPLVRRASRLVETGGLGAETAPSSSVTLRGASTLPTTAGSGVPIVAEAWTGELRRAKRNDESVRQQRGIR